MGALSARLRRRRTRPREVIDRFTSRLGAPIAAEELLLQLVETLKASLRAERAEAWVIDGEALVRAVSVPHRGEGDRVELGAGERDRLTEPNVYGRAWAKVWIPGLLGGRGECSLRIAPVVNQGDPLGLVLVERSAADDFNGAEEEVVDELARHLGLSLRNERLRAELEATLGEVRAANEALRASRSRVVETADSERRRIERDLHDGAQQRLIALSIELRQVQDELAAGSDPGRRLEHAREALDAAIEELADLAHGIYPPILRDSGLGAAIRVAARRHPTNVSVTVEGLGRQPEEVETAIYFAVVEALQNAAKHAADSPVAVTVAERPDGIVFEVVDRGRGFDPATVRRGHGMLSISDRIGAVGGTVEWDTPPGGGTRVRGSIPSART